MSRILTVRPEHARGVRRVGVWVARRRYGGVVPGIFQVMMPDLQLGTAAGWIYERLHLRKRSPLAACNGRWWPPSSTGGSAEHPDWACT